MAYLCIFMITLYYHKVKAICRKYVGIYCPNGHPQDSRKNNKAKVENSCPAVRMA